MPPLIANAFLKVLACKVFDPSLSIDKLPSFNESNVAWFAELGQAISFVEPALIEDNGVKRQVLNLLQQEAGKLKRINWLLFDPGTKEVGKDGEDWKFTGQAEQALSPVKSQYYSFTIDGRSGKMVYRLTNPKAASDFAESNPYEFAATGKKLNCKPGNVQSLSRVIQSRQFGQEAFSLLLSSQMG